MKPSEHKTVQARIFEYADAIGFSYGVIWNTVRRDSIKRNWKPLAGIPRRGLTSTDKGETV